MGDTHTMGDEEDQSQTESADGRKESFEVTDTSKKIIRVITVTTYLFSVSMAAIMLSLYYLFFWNPTVRSGSERLVDPIQMHFSQLYFNVSKRDVGGVPAKGHSGGGGLWGSGATLALSFGQIGNEEVGGVSGGPGEYVRLLY